MRLLFLSNFYPPHGEGGYEQLCREVAHRMAGRGHAVMVLTSAGAPVEASDGPVLVRRALALEVEGGLAQTATKLAFGGRAASERRGVAAVERAVDEFAPDAALVWGMWNVPRVVPAAAERLLPTAYYLCDYWPALPDAYVERLQAPSRGAGGRWPKRLLATVFLRRLMTEPRVSPAYRHVACVSEAIRELLCAQGIDCSRVAIIRNGISLSDFADGDSERPRDDAPLRLVYAGRVTPDKGAATAVDALALLEARSRGMAHLSIYGDGDAGYLNTLRAQVGAARLPVTFHGFVPRDEMPAALARETVLILPSLVAEALPRVMLEAMAAGLAVIGTTTGGTGEVLREGETGLTFRAGDAADLARQIERLAGDPALRARLAAAGRELVLRDFSIDHTVDQLEALLRRIARQQEVATA